MGHRRGPSPRAIAAGHRRGPSHRPHTRQPMGQEAPQARLSRVRRRSARTCGGEGDRFRATSPHMRRLGRQVSHPAARALSPREPAARETGFAPSGESTFTQGAAWALSRSGAEPAPPARRSPQALVFVGFYVDTSREVRCVAFLTRCRTLAYPWVDALPARVRIDLRARIVRGTGARGRSAGTRGVGRGG